MNRSHRCFVAAALGAAIVPFTLRAQDWPQYAQGPQRLSMAAFGEAPPIGVARWTLSQHSGEPVRFPNPGGVVAAAGAVYGVGRLGAADTLFAVDGATGAVRWTAPVPAPTFDSNSTPAVDTVNGVVIVAAGPGVKAFRTADGSVAWAAALMADVVNASPCITMDRGPADRLLITDFDFTGQGRLYCINIDPFDAGANPHAPGDILWSIPIGSASGNTPAYDAGRIYVSCAEIAPGMPGAVRCYPLSDTPPASDLWTRPNPAGQGYYSGVSVETVPGGSIVYAASYGFVGGQLAGDLAAIDGASGSLLWHSPCNRTDSSPVPLHNGSVLISGGLEGFGSVPSLQLFAGDGSLLWDTALATWHDDNGNMQIDPGEYLRVGGWIHQPALNRLRLVVLAGDPGSVLPDKLYALSLLHGPTSAEFIVASYTGAGSTPAIAPAWGVGTVFTTGPAGLFALGAPVCYANCDGSTSAPVLNVLDFGCFLNRFAAGDPYANCDGSTSAPVLNVLDFGCFLNRFAAGCP